MVQSKIETFTAMLAEQPENAMIWYGLAEYLEKVWEVVGRTALEQGLGTAEARARQRRLLLRLANALSALYPRDGEEKRLLDAMLLAAPR